MENPTNDFISNEPRGSAWGVGVRYGLITGILLSVIALALYLAGIDEISTGESSILSSVLNYGIMIGGIVMAIMYHKKENLFGQISFGDAFKTGLFTTLIMAIIGVIWTLVFFNFIAPDAIEIMREIAMEQLDDEQADQMGDMMESFMSPGVIAGSAFVGYLIIGLIISLISSAILKNK